MGKQALPPTTSGSTQPQGMRPSSYLPFIAGWDFTGLREFESRNHQGLLGPPTGSPRQEFNYCLFLSKSHSSVIGPTATNASLAHYANRYRWYPSPGDRDFAF
ncbi:MAG TPA: hypothetical protein VMF06_11095 [Candidatus Limnocylindria bacterium]|nr:hypothetical protein [Candidatus Limnocylindria bacterium]